MERRIIIAGLVGLLIVLVAAGTLFWEEPEERYESSTVMMDTNINIIVYQSDEDKAKGAIEAAFERMREIEAIASRFSESSELYELNTESELANPSPELVEMLEISVRYWEITEGAFDITILPLLDLWDASSGVGPFHLFSMNQSHTETLDSGSISEDIRDIFSDHGYTLNGTATMTVVIAGQEWTLRGGGVDYTVTNTSGDLMVKTPFFWNLASARQDEYIEDAKQFVGSDMITITKDSIQLEPGMGLTLDGMAKGYAADAAIKTLKEKGIKRALVDAGGDIATLGNKPGGRKWVAGLRNPEDKSTSVTEFGLAGQAIATSGNYERYFDENKSVGHIMDPKTGQSVFKASSATIIAKNATVADILATAIFVLGPDDGITLVETLPDTEALLLGYEKPRQIYPSSGLDRYEINDLKLDIWD